MPAAASPGDHEERLLLQDKPIPTPAHPALGWLAEKAANSTGICLATPRVPPVRPFPPPSQ